MFQTEDRFALNFSGQGVAEQLRSVSRAIGEIDAANHRALARLHAIRAASGVFIDPEAALTSAADSRREAVLAADEVSLGWALMAEATVNMSPEGVDQRFIDTREVLRIAADTGETEFVHTAFFLHLSALAELGHIAEMDSALSDTGPLLSAFPWLAKKRHVAWFRCLRATIDGQHALAERIAGEALTLAEAEGDPDAHSVWIGQLSIIRWMQGRIAELEPAFLMARQTSPHEPTWAVSLAWMWIKQGRHSAARALVATLPPVAELPIDRNWLATTCILAEVAADLGDHDLARDVRAALLPFEQRLATIGFGVTCWGTVARPLALVSRALGDTAAAIHHYHEAIEISGRVGAHPWLAEAQCELAALLIDRRNPDDVAEAFALATEAVATGRALNLLNIEEEASRLLTGLEAFNHDAPSLERGLREGAASAQITVLGAFTVVGSDGETAHWQSRKARQLLKILVARRGSAIGRDSLMHLLWPDEAPQVLANRFSVAATTIRRAFDPQGIHPRDWFLDVRDGTARLNVEHIEIDLDRFLHEMNQVAVRAAAATANTEELLASFDLYTGEPFADEPEEPWAEQVRSEVHSAFFSAAHALADASRVNGDQLTRLECFRRILAIDGYDQRAHEGLIETLTGLGAHGRAAAARTRYETSMAELSIPHSEIEFPVATSGGD